MLSAIGDLMNCGAVFSITLSMLLVFLPASDGRADHLVVGLAELDYPPFYILGLTSQ